MIRVGGLFQVTEARSLLFGGVYDNEEDEESLESTFYNDQYMIDLEKGKWHEFYLNGPKQAKQKAEETQGEQFIAILLELLR